MANGFVWYELMTTDAKAAAAFYTKVVGWTAEPAPPPNTDYTMLKAAGANAAGLMTLPKDACDAGARPGWMGYVGVDDLDAMLARLTKAGGAVRMSPMPIPGVGRFAVVADPQGAVFSLFQPGGPGAPPVPAPGTPGSIGWHELMAGDGEKAFDFYAGLFGWTRDVAMDMGPMGKYQLFAVDGQAIGGMMTKPAEVPMPFWGYYWRVDGIGPALERLKAGGAQVMNGPMEVPGGDWIVQAMDAQGAMFALVGPKG
ncbi:MAG: VOC family protein [Proteobacteria bacterium]|nr:VOC family protein [Pseudomonadota bacterium]